MLSEKVEKIIFEIMKNLHGSGYLSPKSITYVAETLQDMDIDFNYKELEDTFNNYLKIIELGVKEEKEHVNKDAGNVEYNISMFNKGFSNAGAAASGEASAGAGCSESCIYEEEKGTLLEAGGFSYLKGRKLSQTAFVSKLFSAPIFNQLFLDNNLNETEVINKGLQGMDPVIPENENASLPKPAFSIKGNAWSQKPADLVGKTHDDTHHIFGFKNGVLSDRVFTTLLPHDVHTKLHNILRLKLKDAFLSGNQEIENVVKTCNYNLKKISKKSGTIYDNAAGLELRQLEYSLRDAAIKIKRTPGFLQKVFDCQGQALLTILSEAPDLIMTADEDNFLKIKAKVAGNDELVECDILPFVLINSREGINNAANLFKITKTDGWYLDHIDKNDMTFVCAILKYTNSDGEQKTKILKSAQEINNVISGNTLLESILTEDVTPSRDLRLLTPQDLKNIIKNNLLYNLKNIDAVSSYEQGLDLINALKKQIPNSHRIGNWQDSFEAEKKLTSDIDTIVNAYVKKYLSNNPVDVYLDSKYNLNYNNGANQIKVNAKDVALRDEDDNEYGFAPAIPENNDYDLTAFINAIANGKITQTNKSCPIFLDVDGKNVKGIFFTDTGILFVNEGCNIDSITTIDFTKADQETKDIIFKNNCDAIKRMWTNNKYELVGLETVIWEPSVNLTYNLFYHCHAHTYKNIFSTASTTLPSMLFKTSGLKEIIIPEHIKRIGEECFAYCYLLEKVVIPAGVSLSQNVFANTKSCNVYFESSANSVDSISATKWGKSQVKKRFYDQNIADLSGYEYLTESINNEKLNESIENSSGVVSISDEDTETFIYYVTDIDAVKAMFKGIEERNPLLLNWFNYAIINKNYLDLQIVMLDGRLFLLNYRDSDGNGIPAIYTQDKKMIFNTEETFVNNTDRNLVNNLSMKLSKVYREYMNTATTLPPGINAANYTGSFYNNRFVKRCFKVTSDVMDLNANTMIYEILPGASAQSDAMSYMTKYSNVDRLNAVDQVNALLSLIKNDDITNFNSAHINLLDLGKDQFVDNMFNTKLSQEVLSELERLNLEESDFNSIVNDPKLNSRLYNIILNAYQRTVAQVFITKARNTLISNLKKAGLDIDPDKLEVGIKLDLLEKNYISGKDTDLDAFFYSLDNYVKDKKDKGESIPQKIYTKDLGSGCPNILSRYSSGTRNLLQGIITDAVSDLKKKEFKPGFWSKEFNDNLLQNLKKI